MPYIGKQPANVPVTADDIPANSIDASKIIDGAITIADIADDAVTADKLANSINSAIAANTAKTGITSGQASAITANTAKTGITSGQATAITAALPKAGGTMTGNLVMGANLVDGIDISARDAILTSTTTTAGAALPKAGGTMTGDLILGDNVKVEIGSASGGDLQLYHDATNSYIHNATGNLYLRADTVRIQNAAGNETLLGATADGASFLAHNDATKLTTTATGVTVTGAVTATSFTGSGAGLTGITTGKVLQVLETIWNTDVTFPQNQNFTSVGTGLTITPTASSSKILVLYTYAITADAGNYSCVHGKLVRDSTNIAENWYMGYVGNEQFHRLQSWSFTYLDSPNTTSSIVYSLTGANGTGSSFSGTYGGGFNVSGLTTRMTLIEIGA